MRLENRGYGLKSRLGCLCANVVLLAYVVLRVVGWFGLVRFVQQVKPTLDCRLATNAHKPTDLCNRSQQVAHEVSICFFLGGEYVRGVDDCQL